MSFYIKDYLPDSAHCSLSRLSQNRRVLSLLDQAVMSVVNMVTSIIIGRTCPRQELGLYASGLSLVLLLTAVQSALIALPYTIHSPKISGQELRIYRGSTFLQQLAVVATGCCIFFAISIFCGSLNQGLRRVLLVLSFSAAFMCFRDLARRVSYAELDFLSALSLDAIYAVTQLIGMFILAYKRQLSAASAIGVVGLSTAVAGCLWLRAHWSSVTFSASHAFRSFKDNWALGKWVFGSSMLWSASIDQYPWLLTTLRGATDTGLWAACYGVMSFLNPIVLALGNDAAPRVAHAYSSQDLDHFRKTVYRSSAVAALLTAPVALGLIFFGGKLVVLMYGAKYVSTQNLISILTMGFWLYAFGLTLPFGLLTLGHARLDFVNNIACFFTFLVAGPWSISRFGVWGAAVSFLIVQFVAVLLRIFTFEKVTRNQTILPYEC